MTKNIVRQIENAIETESLAEFVRAYVSNGNLSIRGTAALVGVNDRALITGADLKSAKLARKLAARGFGGADLTANGFPPKAVWLVIEYYAYESPQTKTDMAIAIARTFGAYGVKAAFKDAMTPPTPALPVPTVAEQTSMLFEAFKGFGLTESPRHMQIARDYVGNLIAKEVGADKALPSGPKLAGVVEIAQQLGYNKYQVDKVGSPLGRAIARWYRLETGEEPLIEDRLVKGRMTPVKVYEVDEDVKEQIADYLDSRNIG